jgi:hypothetical protein
LSQCDEGKLATAEPALASPAAQPSSSSLPTGTVFSSSILTASSTATAGIDCLCTSTPITIICNSLQMPLGATGAWTDLKSRRKPRSYQVTLDSLGRRFLGLDKLSSNRPGRRQDALLRQCPESTPEKVATFDGWSRQRARSDIT